MHMPGRTHSSPTPGLAHASESLLWVATIKKVRHPHELTYARPHIDLELVQTQWWLGQKEEEAHVVARTKALLAQLP